MDFALTDDHLALRDAVARWCDDTHPAPQRGHAESPSTASQRHAGLAELGLLGLCLPADLGGSAQGPVEAMLAAQELGRVLAGGAWLANAVLAGPLLADAGTAAQCQQWLPPLTRGEGPVALACQEAQARYDTADVLTTAHRHANGWLLDGQKSLVLDGSAAHTLLVVARSAGAQRDREGLSIFAVPAGTPGLRVQPITLLDGRRAAHLQLNAVAVPAEGLIGNAGQAFPLIDAAVARANAALCADSTGALEALLALTAEHLRNRKQFGAPLAKFQALQHAVADMAMALEQLKSMACVAAMALGADTTAERDRLVSAAKTLTAQLGRRCGLAAIQLHGAMGMTDECRASHYAKRLITNGLLFGDAAHHLQRCAQP